MPSFSITSKSSTPSLQKQNAVPKSKNPLKSVNWSKISDSDSQLVGTIWEKLDETKLYEKEALNLTQVDKIFELVPQRHNLEVTKRVQKSSSTVIDAKRYVCVHFW